MAKVFDYHAGDLRGEVAPVHVEAVVVSGLVVRFHGFFSPGKAGRGAAVRVVIWRMAI